MLEKVLNTYPRNPEYLIEILLDLQKRNLNHTFSDEELSAVADYLNIPPSRVSSVISFYSFFSMKPKGKYVVQVCKDVPCYLNDSFNLFDLLKKELGIDLGETSEDERFTLETSSCLGCCDMSPVMRINNKVYGNLTANKVKIILSELNGDNHD
ncbi:complex I 24 kDa subunit family protein [Peloplasma aerotolerans]|uniref:NAD(P)H-dependent oxidoreductase subunit E n=1 Tax=Peloplasma aerotolerans TaxID=3044389 RepID=A0AAW6U6M3_9MOLU|nr:NAD(P)H-dependent oxidoreductase subunit E [Mariniplasma sp. M4Ah]MDI6452560.1 NAD(P)H-dependent oxidoreductase subunit E [Mariniplasma sp. M4Ah]